MCSLGLGLVSEPVFAETLTPPFHAAGLPEGRRTRSPSCWRWRW
ncbi:hypothetical protein [Actinomadura madurae]|nr:hypothetical protein [Actinomadura madurae]